MTYLALYREWRPRTFGEIIGQEHITRTLKNAVEAGRVGHAYIFCGARGTGKTTAAKVLAKALNCTGREGAEPCNRCESCRAVNEGISVDVIEIDAASNRGIDEIRDLREKIRFAPAAGRYRVYIIDEVHMLTSEAFNALLKTLEEPPRHAVLILATTEPHRVPLTILSRCQRFDFRRIIPADIIKRLKEVAAGARLEVEEEALRLIARAAEGGLRDALSILDQAAAFGGMKVTEAGVHQILGTVRTDALDRMAGCLAAGEAGRALRLVSELAGEGKDLRLFARELAGYLRALLLEKISPGTPAGEAWGDTARMAAQAAEFSEAGLVRAVEIIARAEQDMKWSAMPGIVLELALVKACRPEAGWDLPSLAARVAGLEEKIKLLAPAEAPVKRPPAAAKAASAPRQAAPAPVPVAVPALPQKQVQEAGGPGGPAEAVSLEQVREAWEDLMNAMRKERLPLYTNYSKAAPLAVKGRVLVVGFPEGEALFKEIAEMPENKKYFEGLLGRFFKGEWQAAFKFYRGRIPLPRRREAPAEPVADVKRRFGGEEITLDDEPGDSLF
ncbi:DNA polymerase III, gamma/tau subunits [Pelotomaculum thermopropionicum SI]|uniref:DNA-directed DNA polymerase n=1 Tax=Pelotomaculum thermopropionicum (strain DSM 13744 / JCM 10971 / SI) TaxID=370438 RepID=A5D6B1_PELTS|nr:DNA polymerase III, gamma/tau subunits [Pelotomaculum thermopropionicum SI]